MVKLRGITVEITEPTSDLAHQKADDRTQLEPTRQELAKTGKIGSRSVKCIKAKRICVDGFVYIALLSVVANTYQPRQNRKYQNRKQPRECACNEAHKNRRQNDLGHVLNQ